MLAAVVMSNRMAQERRRPGGFGDVRRAHTFNHQRQHNSYRRSATSASYLAQQRRRPQEIELPPIPEDYEPYQDREIDRII